ncbi:MAG: hypothetical protein OXF78_10765 [Rhodospirillales bacterium]|nr:hypothetical protein [Rhodospirillales bacterium]
MPEVADLFTPALVVALFTWLRSDVRKLHERLYTTAKNFNDRLDATAKTINQRLDTRFDAVMREIADLRERMAKMEGSLEAFLAGRRDRDAA